MGGLIIPNQTSLKLKTSDSDNPEKHKKNRGPENIFQLTLGLLLGKSFIKNLNHSKFKRRIILPLNLKLKQCYFNKKTLLLDCRIL